MKTGVSWVSSVSVITTLCVDQTRNPGLISNSDKRFTSSPKCVDWLWGSLSLLLNSYCGLFPVG